MKNISFSFLFLLIAFCGVSQIPRSVGTISFLIPAVYSMASFPEGVLLSNVDENKNTYFMFVYLAQRYSGNPQSDFNEAWNKMYGSFSKTVSGSIPVAVKKKHLKGWDYYEAGADCVHNNGQSYYAWLSIHILQDSVIAYGSAAPSQTKFGYNLGFTNTVLNSLCLKSYPATGILSNQSNFNKGISGVWQGVRTAAMLDQSTGRAIKRIVFYDDGVFCNEIPTAGLDSMDRAGHEAWRKGFWGKYSFNGSTGAVDYSTYKNEPLKLAGSNLSFQNVEFEKLRPVDRLLFTGTYTSKTNPKDWWRGYEPWIRFKADGTFEDKSALFDVDNDVGQTCPTAKPGKGKYTCRNYSLVLLYDDGRKGQIALYGIDWKHPKAPEFISLGKGLLKKK